MFPRKTADQVVLVGPAMRYVDGAITTDVEVARNHENFLKFGVQYTYIAALTACPAQDGWRLPKSWVGPNTQQLDGDLIQLLDQVTLRNSPVAESATTQLTGSDDRGPLLYPNRYTGGGKLLRSTHWNGWADDAPDPASYLRYGDDAALLDIRGSGSTTYTTQASMVGDGGYNFFMYLQGDDLGTLVDTTYAGVSASTDLVWFGYLGISPESGWDLSYPDEVNAKDDDALVTFWRNYKRRGEAFFAINVRCLRDVDVQ